MIVIVTNGDTGDSVVEATDEDGKTYSAKVPHELFDDEVGDKAKADRRQAWILENSELIRQAIINKHKGGMVRRPFDRIIPLGEK